MGAILLAALGLRVGDISVERYHAINDAGTYNRLASMIARFGDYHTGDRPRSGAGGSRGPTAYFPPGFPYYLAIADVLDGHRQGGKTAVPPERVEMAVTGTIAVGLLGLVALEAFGEGAAWAALVLAAIYPVFIELSGTLVAENLVVPLELAALWAMLRARRAPGRRVWLWIAAAAILTGLTSLTHENGLLYVIPLALGAWGIVRARVDPARGRRWLRSLGAPTLFVVLCAATIAPWTIRNAVELHAFVPIADEAGITLAGTYNPLSAADKAVPYKWHLFSHVPALQSLAKRTYLYKEVALGEKLQSLAIDYIKAHPLAPLQAAFDNTKRMFELEGAFAWQASAAAVGLRTGVARVGIFCFWFLCLLALAGLFTRRVRRAPWWLWAMPVLWWLSSVLVNMETPRFREPIDPFFVLLGACAVSAAVTRVSSGLRGAPIRRRGRPAQLPSDKAQLVQMVERLA